VIGVIRAFSLPEDNFDETRPCGKIAFRPSAQSYSSRVPASNGMRPSVEFVRQIATLGVRTGKEPLNSR